MEYIDIDKDDLPYSMEIKIGDRTYDLSIDYNTRGDFFTIKTELEDEVISIEKIVYGKPLYTEVEYKNIPSVAIMPYSFLDEDVQRITYENFNDTVFLYLIDPFDEDLDRGDIDEILEENN